MAFYKLWKNWTLRCVRNECFVISNAFTVQKCQQHLKHRNFNNNYCASLIGFSWLHYCIHLFDYWEKHYHTNWDSNHKYNHCWKINLFLYGMYFKTMVCLLSSYQTTPHTRLSTMTRLGFAVVCRKWCCTSRYMSCRYHEGVRSSLAGCLYLANRFQDEGISDTTKKGADSHPPLFEMEHCETRIQINSWT